MRIDEQHRSIRNLQADPDSALIAHSPADESCGDHGFGHALTRRFSIFFPKYVKRHTPYEMLRIAMYEYCEVDAHHTLFHEQLVRTPRPRLRATPQVASRMRASQFRMQDLVPRAWAGAEDGQAMNEKVLEDGSPAMGVRSMLIVTLLGRLCSASLDERLRGLFLFVIDTVSILVLVTLFIPLLLLISTPTS